VLKGPGSIALVLGIVLLLLTGWFLMFGLGFAGLKCPECDCTYELGKPGCQSPIIYLWISLAAFLSSAGFFIASWLPKKRARAASVD
jgi:hypothetical protein